MSKKKDNSEITEENYLHWITFYRRNVHRFIEHYLGINLKLYQVIWIYLMSINEKFMVIASRGSSKSYLIGLYACAKCILYPGTKVTIMSKTLAQALQIITDKIQKELCTQSEILKNEIEVIKADNKGNKAIYFHNGSQIQVVPPSDNARGYRSQINIYEEFRIVDKSIIDSIAQKFLINRQPEYLSNPEYYGVIVDPYQELYISSAGYKNEWIYDALKTFIRGYYTGKSMGFLATDYLISIKHGFKTIQQFDIERETSTASIFDMEYGNLMLGESDDSFFKLEDFKKNSVLKNAFYPYKFEDVILRRNKNILPRDKDEIRIIVADIALAGGQINDNTIIQCFSIFPTNKGYLRQLKYMESLSGMNTEKIVLRLKQLFYDFEANHFVLDIANAGRSIYDSLTKKTVDDMRIREDGVIIEYEAMKITENTKYHFVAKEVIDDLRERTLMKNAIPVIIPVSGTEMFNHLVHMEAKKSLNDGKVEFLINSDKAEEFLYKNKILNADNSMEEKSLAMRPYLETEEMINESIALESIWNGGKLKLKERRSGADRKDRYMTFAYGNYFISVLERDILKETSTTGIDEIMNIGMNINKNNSFRNIFR